MKVFVAEDDVMLADCIVEALTDDGHEVCGVAACVADAVTQIKFHRPDIAILDMQLRRNGRGSEIADQLVEAGSLETMGILYVTGSAERALQEARFGQACLNKPYSLETLTLALEIVGDLVRDGRTTKRLPPGLQLLNHISKRPDGSVSDQRSVCPL